MKRFKGKKLSICKVAAKKKIWWVQHSLFSSKISLAECSKNDIDAGVRIEDDCTSTHYGSINS
jgi:hypothetical protein